MPANKKTVILGASDNPSRYSYLALKKLRANGHSVLAIGNKAAMVDDVAIEQQPIPAPDVDTVTLYLNADKQKSYYDYILSLHPKRIIFNPGAENEELASLARKNGVLPMEACTLVLLGTGQF